MERPIAIIGLDGAAWSVIDPLLAQGKLPNLARTMERGAYGRIATIPGYTSPALWTTIMTGKLPYKHGVLDFYTATASNLRAKPIYEILAPQRVGLFQMYASRRQERFAGFVVPSRVEGSGVAYPPELGFAVNLDAADSLRNQLCLAWELWRHGVPLQTVIQLGLLTISNPLGIKDGLAWRTKINVLGQRARGCIAAKLVERTQPEFFASLFYTPDSAGHYYWKYWEPSLWTGFDQAQVSTKGHMLEDAYRAVDESLGRILKALPESTLIAVVSDHGMEAATDDRGAAILNLRCDRIEES